MTTDLSWHTMHHQLDPSSLQDSAFFDAVYLLDLPEVRFPAWTEGEQDELDYDVIQVWLDGCGQVEVGEKSLSSLAVLEPFYSLIAVELYQDTPIAQLGDSSGLVFKGALCRAEGPVDSVLDCRHVTIPEGASPCGPIQVN